MLYNLEEILSFNFIFRMLGIDPEITEKSGCKNSISEWRTFGMAGKKSAAVNFNRFTVNIFDLRKTCIVGSFRGDSKL